MNEIITGGAIAIISAVFTAILNLFLTQRGAKINLKNQIAFLNRNEVMTTYKELASLLGNINSFLPLFLDDRDRVKTISNFEKASTAFCIYWDANYGKMNLFIPENIVKRLTAFRFNLENETDNASEFKSKEEFEILNGLSSESSKIINLLRDEIQS